MRYPSTSSLTRVFFAVLFLAGCGRETKQTYVPVYGKDALMQSDVVEYICAIHPLHNSRRYFEVYQPLVNFVNRQTKEFSVRLEASADYAQFEQNLINRKYHFALPNPYQSYTADTYGYSIIGKMGDDERFYGIIAVRKDSRIRSIRDLRGAAISFPSATALAAAMMPKYFLKMHGLDVERDAVCRYVGSQESSIMNVYLGKTKAACTWPQPWESFLQEHPEVAAALTVQWRTDPLINNGLVARNDVPERHAKIFAGLLFNLHTHEEGRVILKRINLSCFTAITHKEYASRVDVFLDKYRRLFGSLPALGEHK